MPLTTQVANHLSRKGNFTENDLILVLGGNNDIRAVRGLRDGRGADPGRCRCRQHHPDQANQLLFAAQQEAMAGMKTAALELANTVVTQIPGKGGKYVIVMTILDPIYTPFGASLPAEVQPVLSGLSQNFNLWLRDGLTGQPVQLIDTESLFAPMRADPAKYGIANLTIPACDAAKIAAITGGAITDGSSLFCNSDPPCPGTASATVPT